MSREYMIYMRQRMKWSSCGVPTLCVTFHFIQLDSLVLKLTLNLVQDCNRSKFHSVAKCLVLVSLSWRSEPSQGLFFMRFLTFRGLVMLIFFFKQLISLWILKSSFCRNLWTVIRKLKAILIRHVICMRVRTVDAATIVKCYAMEQKCFMMCSVTWSHCFRTCFCSCPRVLLIFFFPWWKFGF